MEALLCQSLAEKEFVSNPHVGFRTQQGADCSVQNVEINPVSANSGTASLAVLLGSIAGDRPLLQRKNKEVGKNLSVSGMTR